MKKMYLFITAAAMSAALGAQSLTPAAKPGSTYLLNTGFYETIAVRDMPLQTEEQRIQAAARHQRLEELREAKRPKFADFKKKDEQPDAARQTANGTHPLAGPVINFDGQADANSCPPDPDGAVGSTQFVQAVNSSYQVFTKAGAAATGVIDLASLFTNIPGDDGDPIVLFDKFADRWVITEFQVSVAPCGFSVAISKTADATGGYYVYNFSNALWSTQNYPDYPKFSVWSDGYYMTGQYSPEGVVVLDRTRMLAGKQSAGMVLTAAPTSPAYFGGNNSLYTAAKTLDCDASALPPYGSPEYLVFFENLASGGFSDKIVFYKCMHDTTAHTLAVTRADSLSPTTFNAYFSGGSEMDISQPGSATSLDALDGTFNFRTPFMSFTNHNSVVLCNTVNVGSGVAGIRWYEIRQNGVGLPWSIYQQGTYAPADGSSRWNGSIGMDQNGDIALEYSISSSTVYPSIGYTGRMSTDALNSMTGAEQLAITGTAPAISCGNRWGDYSEMTLDPTDGLTFWNTNEYCKASVQASRIFAFKLPLPAGIENAIDLAVFKIYQTDNFLNVSATKLPSDDNVQVDLFDMVGKQISHQVVKPTNNAVQTTVSVSGLPAATYFVRIGNADYQRVFKVHVSN